MAPNNGLWRTAVSLPRRWRFMAARDRARQIVAIAMRAESEFPDGLACVDWRPAVQHVAHDPSLKAPWPQEVECAVVP